MQYNNPTGGVPSSVGAQFNVFLYQKKALIEAAKKAVFSPMASTQYMPKHFGKEIRLFHYVPILDSRNLNDQGIDATGVTIDKSKYYVTLSRAQDIFPTEAAADAAKAALDAVTGGGGSSIATKGGSGSAWTLTYSKAKLAGTTQVLADAIKAAVPAAYVQQGSGNLYGSSKDPGVIAASFPTLDENGGRVNRVGYVRRELSGTFNSFGFFHEWTAESLAFDTDAELEMHWEREMLIGAQEISEDMLQVDLLDAAGVIRYAGTATTPYTLNASCVVTYSDIMRLGIDLDNNLAEKGLKIIAGSRMTDTRTIPGARVMYIGSELLPTLKAMKDLHNNPAFIEVHKYADAAGNGILNGEVGSIDNFRIVVVQKMLRWQNAGAVRSDASFYGDSRYDVFPMLVVTSDTFTTIGFQTDGTNTKWKTYMKKPGIDTVSETNPFGRKGLSSIQWYYGFLCYRPERIGLIKTVAKM